MFASPSPSTPKAVASGVNTIVAPPETGFWLPGVSVSPAMAKLGLAALAEYVLPLKVSGGFKSWDAENGANILVTLGDRSAMRKYGSFLLFCYLLQ